MSSGNVTLPFAQPHCVEFPVFPQFSFLPIHPSLRGYPVTQATKVQALHHKILLYRLEDDESLDNSLMLSDLLNQSNFTRVDIEEDLLVSLVSLTNDTASLNTTTEGTYCTIVEGDETEAGESYEVSTDYIGIPDLRFFVDGSLCWLLSIFSLFFAFPLGFYVMLNLSPKRLKAANKRSPDGFMCKIHRYYYGPAGADFVIGLLISTLPVVTLFPLNMEYFVHLQRSDFEAGRSSFGQTVHLEILLTFSGTAMCVSAPLLIITTIFKWMLFDPCPMTGTESSACYKKPAVSKESYQRLNTFMAIISFLLIIPKFLDLYGSETLQVVGLILKRILCTVWWIGCAWTGILHWVGWRVTFSQEKPIISKEARAFARMALSVFYGTPVVFFTVSLVGQWAIHRSNLTTTLRVFIQTWLWDEKDLAEKIFPYHVLANPWYQSLRVLPYLSILVMMFSWILIWYFKAPEKFLCAPKFPAV